MEVIYCLCGCGMPVSNGRKYRQGHWMKIESSRKYMSKVNSKGQPCNHGDGYLTKLAGFNKGHKLLHRIIAEQTLGKPLPSTAVVHHIDENRSNNSNSNLVICQDAHYHGLLHTRLRALKACGNADWRLCSFCGKWDDPKNLYIPPRRGTVEHRSCGREYRRKYYAQKNKGDRT